MPPLDRLPEPTHSNLVRQPTHSNLVRPDTSRPTRREFLHGAAATGLVLAASGATPRIAGAASERGPLGRKVRMGIVGGRFGTTFQWHLDPDVEVAAVSDLRPERLAALQKTYSCANGVRSLEEMVEDRSLDAIAICTEAPNHFRHSMLALSRGKHVFCAVPAAMTLEECELLIAEVKRTGLTYMMAETSYYRDEIIAARRMYEAGEFGELFCCEAEYHHDGLESLFWEDGDPTKPRTWRYGFPPMHYPTHSTSMLTGVTGERLVRVSCLGWGDDSPILKDNAYGNPFWSATAFFQTDRGHACRIAVYWKVAAGGCERARWYGSRRSFHMSDPNGLGAMIASEGEKVAPFVVPQYYQLELPESMRVQSGHGNSHAFLTREFADAIARGRRPAIDIYESVAYTAPGIVAHQSALKGGESMAVPDFGRAEA